MIEPPFPECCKYCPHKETVKANCSHSQVQMLTTYLSENSSRACPVFVDQRSAQMARLAESLTNNR